MHRIIFLAVCVSAAISPLSAAADLDVLIRGGLVFDGSGGDGKRVDVAIHGDRIAGVGDFKSTKAKVIIDAQGLAVAPGFINMLSWSNESLIEDGRSQGEIREGVTTEIMGEGESMGPVNDRVKEKMLRDQSDINYDIKWKTLAEYLRFLEKRGISCNVASFIGATTIRAMSSALKTRRRRRSSSKRCASLCGRKWKRARLASALPSFIRRLLCEDRRTDRALQSRREI